MTDGLPTSYYVRDLTVTGIPPSKGFSIASDEQMYQLNPARYGFYMQLLNALQQPNGTQLVDQLIATENQTRYTREQLEKKAETIVNNMRYLHNKFSRGGGKVGPDEFINNFTTTTAQENLNTLNNDFMLLKQIVDDDVYRHQLSEKLKQLKNYYQDPQVKFKYTAKDDVLYDDLLDEIGNTTNSITGYNLLTDTSTTTTTTTPPLGGGLQDGGAAENKFETFLNNITNASDFKSREKYIHLYNEDPIIGPSTEDISTTDRVIFIAMTFALRAITLFVIQWGLNTYMIRSFEQAFRLYFLVYVSLFFLWVLLVNTVEKDLVFRMMFYYVSVDPHGYGRMLAHFAVHIVFLPIPLLVKTKEQDPTSEEFTFEKRRSIFRLLSMLTFFMWIITSAIAFQY
jgi:hypothetical protein